MRPKPMPNGMTQHKTFLKNLNEQVIRPYMVFLQTSYASAAAGTPASVSETLPSDKDFFCYGLKGFMQYTPAGPPAPEEENANFISVQINANPTDVNLFNTPTKLSTLVSWPGGDSEYLRFPIPWRMQGGAVITAAWSALAGMPATTTYFGILLVGEVVIISDL